MKVGFAYEIGFKSHQSLYSKCFSQGFFFSVWVYLLSRVEIWKHTMQDVHHRNICKGEPEDEHGMCACVIRIYPHICIKCKSFHMGLLSSEAMLFTCKTLHKVFYFSWNPPGKLMMEHEKLLRHTWMHLRPYRWHLYCFITHTFSRYCPFGACLYVFS